MTFKEVTKKLEHLNNDNEIIVMDDLDEYLITGIHGQKVIAKPIHVYEEELECVVNEDFILIPIEEIECLHYIGNSGSHA